MKHILTLLSLIFVILAIYNFSQPVENLSLTTVIGGLIGAVYLVVMMLRGRLKGGSA